MSIAWPFFRHASWIHILILRYPKQEKLRWTSTKVITLTQTVVFGDSWGATAIDPWQNDPTCGFGRGTLRDWALPHVKIWQDSLNMIPVLCHVVQIWCSWSDLWWCPSTAQEIIRREPITLFFFAARWVSRSLSSLLVVCCLSRRHTHTHSHWKSSNKGISVFVSDEGKQIHRTCSLQPGRSNTTCIFTRGSNPQPFWTTCWIVH